MLTEILKTVNTSRTTSCPTSRLNRQVCREYQVTSYKYWTPQVVETNGLLASPQCSLLVLSTHPRHDLSSISDAIISSFTCFNRMRLFKRRCSDPSPQLVSLSPICQDVVNDVIPDDPSVRTRHDLRPPPMPGSSKGASACEESLKTNTKGEGHCQCCSYVPVYLAGRR